ncbi:MAG: hypothetical protein Q8N21_04275 [bacterium]|nr:hypothetical protein [bacterium]
MHESIIFSKKSIDNDNLDKGHGNSVETPTVNQRDIYLNPEEGTEDAKKLEFILLQHSNERVLVLGPPCAGKSTLLQHIKDGVDMDIVFDEMPKKFKRYILHQENPFMYIDGDKKTVKFTEMAFLKDSVENIDYLRKTTDYLTRFINLHTKITHGRPVFGTCVVETDVIVYCQVLKILYHLGHSIKETFLINSFVNFIGA